MTENYVKGIFSKTLVFSKNNKCLTLNESPCIINVEQLE